MSAIILDRNAQELVGEEVRGFSDEAIFNLKKSREAYSHFYSVLTSHGRSFIIEFYDLMRRWKEETLHSSSIIEISMNPNYQKIIGMGEKAVPLILRELEFRPDHWFWALKAITGAEPIQPVNRGKVKEMAKDWLSWAKEKGFI